MISTLHPVAESYPLQECLGVASVAHCAGCHDPHLIGPEPLCSPVKPAQNMHRVCHRFGCQKARAENAVAQARDLAIFVDGLEFAPAEPGDFQTNRIRTNIDGSEDRHEAMSLRSNCLKPQPSFFHKANF